MIGLLLLHALSISKQNVDDPNIPDSNSSTSDPTYSFPLIKLIYLLDNYKLDDQTATIFGEILDTFPPEKTLKKFVEEINPVVAIFMSNISTVFNSPFLHILPDPENREIISQFANQLVDPIQYIWTGNNLPDALNTFLEKSMIDGLKKAGFDIKKIEEIIQLIDQSFNGKRQYTLKEAVEKILKVDYTYMYNFLKKAVEEKEFNINLIDEKLVQEMKTILAAPYHLIGLVGEIANGIFKPILTILKDPNFQANVGKAIQSIKSEEGPLTTLRFILERIQIPDREGETMMDHRMTFYENGGIRKMILSMLSGEQKEIITALLDFIDKRNTVIPYQYIEALNQMTLQLFTELTAKLYAFSHFSPDHKINIGISPMNIPFEMKISSLISNVFGNIPVETDDLLAAINNFGDKLETAIPILEHIIGPVYPIIKPVVELTHKITTAIGKDMTIEEVICSAVKNGNLIVDLVRKIFKYANDGAKINCELVNGIEWAKNYIAQFDKLPNLGNDLSWFEVYCKLGYNNETGEFTPHPAIENAFYKFFCSFEGQGKMMEVFPFIKNCQNIFKPNNGAATFDYLLETVKTIGDCFTVNPFGEIKTVVDPIATAFTSTTGNLNNVAKEVFKCDLYLIGASLFSVCFTFYDDVMFSPVIRYVNKAVRIMDQSLPSVAKAGDQYVNEINPSSGLSSGQIAGITIGVIAGLAIIAVVAFFVIKKRRNTYDHVTENGSLTV